MMFADFDRAVKTSDLEKALSTTLTELGYKTLKVTDDYCSKEYVQGEMVPIKEGVEYEVRRNFLTPKIRIGFKFKHDYDINSNKLIYRKELAKQLYASVYSLNSARYEKTLLDIIKSTVNKINKDVETKNDINIIYYK